MKLIIAGTRTIKIDAPTILGLMESCGLDLHSETGHEIVSGGCPTGPDAAAKSIQKYIGVTYREFPADWEVHGRSAGPLRNKQMAEYADALLLIWDGKSKGSLSMRNEMLALKKPVYEVVIRSVGNDN